MCFFNSLLFAAVPPHRRHKLFNRFKLVSLIETYFFQGRASNEDWFDRSANPGEIEKGSSYLKLGLRVDALTMQTLLIVELV